MDYLVDFKNETTDQEIQTYLTDNNCTVLKEWDNFDKVFLVQAATSPPLSSIVERVIEETPLKIKPLDVYSHHVNGEVDSYLGAHNDPTKEKITIETQAEKDWWKNYSYANPVFDQPSYTISRLGKNINVYLVDSGVETSHPEFAEANIVNLYTVTPNDFSDYNGHGTALASVIVGKTCGITNATLKSVKIFDPNHQTLQSEFLSALDAIINDHVDNTFSIINCSWIIEKNDWVEHKLRILFDEGVSIMAAAGNQGTSIEDVTPASMIEALTVGAYNKDLAPCDFSNYTGTSGISVTSGGTNHGELDGWAPGEQIWAAGLNGTYAYVAGTSIATAISTAVLVSNISWHVNAEGEMIPNWYGTTFAAINPEEQASSDVFYKEDFLDLSDPKYANSKNRIAGLFDRAWNTPVQTPDSIFCNIRKSDVDKYIIAGTLFAPRGTKKVEWITPLPEHFIATVEGKLLGNPALIQGPTELNSYILHKSSYKRTNTDDTEETINVDIYVYAENFTPEALPEDDPAVQIYLQSTCSARSPCVTNSLYVLCSDQCVPPRYCCDYLCSVGKIYYQCLCGQSC